MGKSYRIDNQSYYTCSYMIYDKNNKPIIRIEVEEDMGLTTVNKKL